MFRENDRHVNKHWIYLDGNEDPIILPCVFAFYTQCTNHKIDFYCEKGKADKEYVEGLREVEVGDDAATKINGHLGRFLEWVDDYKTDSNVSLDFHTALPPELINEYINEYLIDECSASQAVANDAVNSLKAYFNWLSRYFKNNAKSFGIKSAYRPIARNNSQGKLSVKYMLPEARELFYSSTTTLLEEIVLRNGGDVGCRAKENQGFLLDDFKSGKEKHSGLLTLFKELERNPEQEEFKYYLSSLYTKYGRSRVLYIPNVLLKKMKDYYYDERPKSGSNHLLVSNSDNSRGKCISKAYACDVFLKIKRKLMKKVKDNPSLYATTQEIEEAFSYHILRHSFGTDIFYNMCEGQNKHFESITTTSAVYLETARRLGHKVDGRGANEVTKQYIHACGYREALLKDVVNG